MKSLIMLGLLTVSLNTGCRNEKEDANVRAEPEGANPGECTDGADNDYDGDYDCNDADCARAPDCFESDCTDGADNDRDGDYDCNDSDCADDEACQPVEDTAVEDTGEVDIYEGDDPGECSDGIDNDGDGDVDCADEDCSGSPDCEVESPNYEGDEPGECSDGLDNDQDGEYDCDDQDCYGSPDCQNNAEYSVVHTGNNGNGKRWRLAQDGSGGQDIFMTNVNSIQDCADLCANSTQINCAGFMYKFNGTYTGSSEPCFTDKTCTLMTVLQTVNTYSNDLYSARLQ